jgi:hypothetical protein
MGKKETESWRQRAEGRWQMAESGERRADGKWQRADGGEQRAESGEWKRKNTETKKRRNENTEPLDLLGIFFLLLFLLYPKRKRRGMPVLPQIASPKGSQ